MKASDTQKEIEERAWSYRDTFAGIVQGSCEDCGNCQDDRDGNCPCDHIVHEIIAAIIRIDEEAASLAREREGA